MIESEKVILTELLSSYELWTELPIASNFRQVPPQKMPSTEPAEFAIDSTIRRGIVYKSKVRRTEFVSQHGPIWPRFWTKLIAWLGLAALLLQPGCRLFQSTEPESNLRTTVAPDGLRPARDTSGRLRSGLSNESQEIEKNLGY